MKIKEARARISPEMVAFYRANRPIAKTDSYIAGYVDYAVNGVYLPSRGPGGSLPREALVQYDLGFTYAIVDEMAGVDIRAQAFADANTLYAHVRK